MTLLVYKYDVAGVTYEASQDVTHLRQFIDLYSCRLGLPASVKYDPHNPGDSVVISETWSGLRRSPLARAGPRHHKTQHFGVTLSSHQRLSGREPIVDTFVTSASVAELLQ